MDTFNERQKGTPFIHDPATEVRAQISPDGKWVAYDSNETGRPEVYVKTFPGGDGKRQISATGGLGPRWSGDGKELFFLKNFTTMASVKVNTSGSTLTYGAPVDLFELGSYRPPDHPGGSFHFYAVSPDGNRILFPRENVATRADLGAEPITVIVNWFATLK